MNNKLTLNDVEYTGVSPDKMKVGEIAVILSSPANVCIGEVVGRAFVSNDPHNDKVFLVSVADPVQTWTFTRARPSAMRVRILQPGETFTVTIRS